MWLTGVNVTGIFAWSIFDNFEWFSGNQVKFGVQYLNATSMERVPKASLFQMLNWFKAKGGATHPGVGGNSTMRGRLTKRIEKGGN
jgi:beta-glucosidase/6-phospho-beta-glucosidase/beta-galactosidase